MQTVGYVLNGRRYQCLKFETDAEANEFMEQNGEWGVLDEDHIGFVFCARCDDHGVPL